MHEKILKYAKKYAQWDHLCTMLCTVITIALVEDDEKWRWKYSEMKNQSITRDWVASYVNKWAILKMVLILSIHGACCSANSTNALLFLTLKVHTAVPPNSRSRAKVSVCLDNFVR